MTLRSYLALAAVCLLAAPTVSWAGKLTCLTGTAPSVANDLSQITAVRAEIYAACPCASFDGGRGKTHAKYITCASGIISAQVSAGNLRTQCKTTVKKYYSTSTCGVPASKGDVACITTSAAGKVTCAIKPSTKCSGTPCTGFSTCIDAADTNGDGLIGAGDSGACLVVGGDRPVTVHVPPSYSPDTPMPLVVMLHGYGASGAIEEAYLGLTSVSDARGFLYVYPDGTVDQSGLRFWNATPACCNFFGSTVVDFRTF